MAEVKGQVDRLRKELCQKDWRISDLQQERQTLEFCVQEMKSALEEEKRSCTRLLRETEQKMEEEQQRRFHSVIIRMKEMGEKLDTAEKTCAVFRTSQTDSSNTLIKNLQQEVTRLKQEAERFGEAKVAPEEVSRLQEESERKGERVKTLEQQLLESQNIHDNLKSVNSDLQAEVSNLKGVIREFEQRAALPLKDSTPKQNEKTDTELSNKEAQLAKKEAELATVQQEAQEARKREVERRRELHAVAEEAIAQKEAELQKREAEISR